MDRENFLWKESKLMKSKLVFFLGDMNNMSKSEGAYKYVINFNLWPW